MRYSIYGLTAESDVRIPRLIPCEPRGAADLLIELAAADRLEIADDSGDAPWYRSLPPGEGAGVTIFKAAGGGYRLRFAADVQFLVDAHGCHVRAGVSASSSLDDLAIYLTGPVLGFVLRLRGLVALHASVVAIDGTGVAIAGPAGAGKSTTAAAFAARAHPVLTDDLAALDLTGEHPLVHPGHPQVALWPDVSSALFGAPDALPPLATGWEKRCLDLGARGQFVARALPLSAIYVLSVEPAVAVPFVRAVPRGMAVMMLLANFYGNLLLHRERRVTELDAAHAMAASIPVRQLVRGDDSHGLAGLCDLLLKDIGLLSRAEPFLRARRVPADVQHC